MRGGQKLTFSVRAEFHPAAQHLPMLASPGNQALMLDLQKAPDNTP
jgi:hypothetical protein